MRLPPHRSLVAVLLTIWCLTLSAVVFADGQQVNVVGLGGGITSGSVTCGTSATAVPASALAGRRSIAIVNISGADVFIGPSTETTATGFQLADGGSLTLDATGSITAYCISAAGGKEIRYLEIR